MSRTENFTNAIESEQKASLEHAWTDLCEIGLSLGVIIPERYFDVKDRVAALRAENQRLTTKLADTERCYGEVMDALGLSHDSQPEEASAVVERLKQERNGYDSAHKRECAKVLELTADNLRLQQERDDFQIMANCGGIRTDKTCNVDGDTIYGPYFGNGDGTFTCEFHGLMQRATAAEAQVGEYREALTNIIAAWDGFDGYGQDESARITQSLAAARALLRAEKGE